MQDLLAEYGGLLDLARYDDWLALFAAECRYRRAARELRPGAAGGADLLRQPRHAGRPHHGAARGQQIQHPHRPPPDRPAAHHRRPGGLVEIEAPFAVYQTDQEGETRLFATGLYRDRLEMAGGRLRIAEKLVLLDTSGGADTPRDAALTLKRSHVGRF